LGFALAEPSTGPRAGVPLAVAKPKDGVVSNAPSVGITAVIAQMSPATHGSNMIRRKGTHDYAHPYAQWNEEKPFTKLEEPFAVDQPYLAAHTVIAGFIESAFAGSTPVVKDLPTPVLDFDGDGAADDDDASPNDPTKK
jgi:hypothetical protein